jgi:hypothetical protein
LGAWHRKQQDWYDGYHFNGSGQKKFTAILIEAFFSSAR